MSDSLPSSNQMLSIVGHLAALHGSPICTSRKHRFESPAALSVPLISSFSHNHTYLSLKLFITILDVKCQTTVDNPSSSASPFSRSLQYCILQSVFRGQDELIPRICILVESCAPRQNNPRIAIIRMLLVLPNTTTELCN